MKTKIWAALLMATLANTMPAVAQTTTPTPAAAPAGKSAKQIQAFCSRYLTGSKLQACVDTFMGKPVDSTMGLPPEEAALIRLRGTPCHIETYDGGSTYTTETFWYCNPEGSYEEAFTFTNGRQTSHYIP